MKHGRFLKGIWTLPVVIAALIAAHGLTLYRVFSRMAWTVALGLLVVLLLMHVGALGSIYAMLRRWLGHKS